MKIKKILNIINEESIQKFPKIWYHGSSFDFDKFDASKAGANFEQSILGIYLSQYKLPPPYGTNAKEYANNSAMSHGGTPIIYTCTVNIKNPLILDSNGWSSSVQCIDKQKNDIKRTSSNYDCVIAYNHDEDFEYAEYIIAVFDDSKIKVVSKEKLPEVSR